ncbi:phage baseplate assembly protein V [Desulfoluna spongiiphila]|uniref:Gp5/Type VI secretion system Vgr protein OB-fold domain-containing protein n=1 Tax=Desulfoluna spongiiphila TaxID=419481 RepID=A0A1G5J3S2_9BACT|nr:phage baseplate assembly protein V [Desulfoluna spongiiphila]SCY82358.1 hypothetical protein SAMN05216233_12423 [Desulfoluna spongiiphila]
MSLEQMISVLTDKIEHHYYGKYRGLVVDNRDPEGLGRLKIRVPSVLGPDTVTGWATACVPFGGDANRGVFFVPEVGAGVWVEFEEGHLEFPIWVGTYWSKPRGESEVPKPVGADGVEEGQVQDPPTAKIIKTAKGHTLQFEDRDGDERITLVEARHNHVLTMDVDGIALSHGTGGHSIALTDSEVSVTTASGATVTLTESGVTVDAGPGTVEVKGSAVRLGSASAPVIRIGDQGIGNLGAPVAMSVTTNTQVFA